MYGFIEDLNSFMKNSELVSMLFFTKKKIF